MNVLILYNSTQTYTNTVYEHLLSLKEHSRHRIFFAHADPVSELNVDLGCFDAVGIHFTIRLPFDQVSPSVARALEAYSGLKFLFIQDEYDYPRRTWSWINRLGMQLVFTVVPEPGISTVYPPSEFSRTRFVSILTGYVPEKLPPLEDLPWPSQRSLMVGYRGRPLPVRYGLLGFEKVAIGAIVKEYCDQTGVVCDIAWSEESRIYGHKWYEFVLSCRSMLGSESGSNVFDWDGNLKDTIEALKLNRPGVDDDTIYRELIAPLEIHGLMNQLSPRVFEAIASRTILVLFEGSYSGVIRPWEHYIPLKKDGSNIAEVMSRLADGDFVDNMADRAWRDVIGSGNYSYKSFVNIVDKEIDYSYNELGCCSKPFKNVAEQSLTPITTEPIRANPPKPSTDTIVHAFLGSRGATSKVVGQPLTPITTEPIRANPPKPSTDTIFHTFVGSQGAKDLGRRFAIYLWWKLPESVREILKPRLKRLLGKG